MVLHVRQGVKLPEDSYRTQNAGLENDIPFRMGDFSGSMLVFRGILKPKKHTTDIGPSLAHPGLNRPIDVRNSSLI